MMSMPKNGIFFNLGLIRINGGVVRRTSYTITVSSGIRDEVLVLLIISNNRIRGNQWDVMFV